MSFRERQFHEQWIGHLQPDGLVLSVPTLVEAQCMSHQPTQTLLRLRELCSDPQASAANDDASYLRDLPAFFEQILQLPPSAFDRGDALPEALSLILEGQQCIRPTMALRPPKGPASTRSTSPQTPNESANEKTNANPNEKPEESPAVTAGKAYLCLVWDLAEHHEAGLGLPFDKAETSTGEWHYPPATKFERLLRHCQVPIGLLTNRHELRLIYAPHGQSTGSMTFPLATMTQSGGRCMLDALVMLLGANRWFGVAKDQSLPALLKKSRERQGEVTHQLADQVFEALEILVEGFQVAVERDPNPHLKHAFDLALDTGLSTGLNTPDDQAPADPTNAPDTIYGGLLAVVLRTVFLLFAEDRELMPMGNNIYREHYSMLGLYQRLLHDRARHPDSMEQRFGAWAQLVATWRAVYRGVHHPRFQLPARRGELFNPNAYAFLEGWDAGGSAPFVRSEARARVQLPSISDHVVLCMLEKLLVLDHQRLSYRALAVEQIGSVYEALMGYHVIRLDDDALALRPEHAKRVWLSVQALHKVPAAQREKWLKNEMGLSKSAAQKVIQAVGSAKTIEAMREALSTLAPSKSPQRSRPSSRHPRHPRSGPPSLQPAGRLVIQPGQERRRTSSHYTPRELTEPLVARTLEPVLASLNPQAPTAPRSEQILSLKICDPAMGTGAFLVAVVRYLGEALVAAWTREGIIDEVTHQLQHDPTIVARRWIAQRCIYGVDKNRFAVHLAKLSVWLETLAHDLPFTFMDHALCHGDSLVGVDYRAISDFHWQASGEASLAPGPQQLELLPLVLDEALAEARQARAKILELAHSTASPGLRAHNDDLYWQQGRCHEDANDALDRLRLIGDVLLGAFFAQKKAKDRDAERQRRKDLVLQWLHSEDEAAQQAAYEQLLAWQRALWQGDYTEGQAQPSFHWWLEFPEIFMPDRHDPLEGQPLQRSTMKTNPDPKTHPKATAPAKALMDAFVGNPPFLGGGSISSRWGDAYLAWIKEMHPGTQGQADLCVHFFRRADALLGDHGGLGLVATNTISQGDTRSTGLQYLINQRGYRYYDATPTLPWPGAATVTVSMVHLARGRVAQAMEQAVLRQLNPDHPGARIDKTVAVLNSRSRPRPERPDPVPLRSNEDQSYLGSKIYGQGFVLSPEERKALIARDPHNAERIFPYLGGQEVNTHPEQMFDRYVINFGDMPLEEAEQWPDLLAIVREKVKPERDKNKREVRRKYWWRFGETTPSLYAALAKLPRCLVTARVTKHLCFTFQPTNRVLNEKLYIFPLTTFTSFAVLQSRLHVQWTWLLSSTLGKTLNYSATDCFANFPFPRADPRTVIGALEDLGQRLYESRAAYMRKHQVGLTETYNRLKDPNQPPPELLSLRELHQQLDAAVLQAYGWSDLDVPPFVAPQTEAERQTQQAFQDEVIDRLFALNAQRAEQEQLLGQAQRSPAKKKRGKANKASKTTKAAATTRARKKTPATSLPPAPLAKVRAKPKANTKPKTKSTAKARSTASSRKAIRVKQNTG